MPGRTLGRVRQDRGYPWIRRSAAPPRPLTLRAIQCLDQARGQVHSGGSSSPLSPVTGRRQHEACPSLPLRSRGPSERWCGVDHASERRLAGCAAGHGEGGSRRHGLQNKWVPGHPSGRRGTAPTWHRAPPRPSVRAPRDSSLRTDPAACALDNEQETAVLTEVVSRSGEFADVPDVRPTRLVAPRPGYAAVAAIGSSARAATAAPAAHHMGLHSAPRVRVRALRQA